LGVVGSILGKEMGKDLPRALGLFVMHRAPAISIFKTANVSSSGQGRAETLIFSFAPSTK